MSEQNVFEEPKSVTLERGPVSTEKNQDAQQDQTKWQKGVVTDIKRQEDTARQTTQPKTQASETQTATAPLRVGTIDIYASRTDSAILLSDTSKEDSPEMAEVKRTLWALEERLQDSYNDKSTFDELERLYNSAIDSCQDYVTKKNPRFPAGKKRKSMVERVKNNLIMERALLIEEIKYTANKPLNIKKGMECYEILNTVEVGLPADEEAKAVLLGKQMQLEQMKRAGHEDSPEMKQVKKANSDLFRLLYDTRTGAGNTETLTDMVKIEFASVISACNDYIGAKSQNPKTRDGKIRLAAVKELKSRYEKEQSHISGAITAIKSKGEDVSLASAYKRINGSKDIFAFDLLEAVATESKTATASQQTTQTSGSGIEMSRTQSQSQTQTQTQTVPVELLNRLSRRVLALRREAGAYDDPVPSDWIQDESQRYSNSCWAVSGMNLINCFNTRHNPTKGRVIQEYLLDLDGQQPLKFNTALKRSAYGSEMDEYFDEERTNVERFLTNPDRWMGNVRSASDRLLEATDGKAIVRSKRFNVFINPRVNRQVSDQRSELVKLEMLKAVHEALTLHQSPVSVLCGAHYVTIVGISGRDFICKNSLNHFAVNSNERISVDTVFSQNQRNRTVEFVWLQNLDQAALDGIRQEFPNAHTAYEERKAGRLEAGGDFNAADYTHVDGCDISKIEADELHDTNEVQTTAYVPKVLPAGLTL